MATVRRLTVVPEFRLCEEIQRKVWAFEDREVIPSNELIAITHGGGLVLGAFEEDRMVGFCFGFTGWANRRAFHCSRMLAVLPAYRDKDIGAALKWEQRRWCHKEGFDLVRWTFDPLQSLNAYFNIEKLGVTAHEYIVDLYGNSSSHLNRGVDTDRFMVDWEIHADRVERRARGRKGDTPTLAEASSIPRVNPTSVDSMGLLRCEEPDLSKKDSRLLVEVPPSIQALKAADIALAKDWRAKSRAVFQIYFKRGYLVSGFVTGQEGDARRSYYLLSKDASPRRKKARR
ncbi:MAG: GNAT family N-acetyltransferase [Planctomycetota bacterium]